MNTVWQRLTLSNLHLSQWRGSSYFYRLVGALGQWREGSLLLQWSELLGALFVSLVLVSAPFVSNSLILIPLAAAGAYWMLLTLTDNGKSGITPIHLLALLYWGIATIAMAFSPVKAQALRGWVQLTLYLLMFALAARIMRSPRLTSWLITIFLLVSLLVSLYGVRQQFFGVEQLATWNDPLSPLAWDTRVYSFLGNPNLLARYLLPAIALSLAALFVWRGWLPKALAAMMVVVNCACLYFTDSRGGWLAMVSLSTTFLLLLYFWFRDRFSPFWRVWLLPIVFGSLVALLAIAFFSVEPLHLRVLSIFAGAKDSSSNFRIHVWTAVVEMIRDRPLFGIGPGKAAFEKIYPLYMHPRYTASGTYSIYLETAVETGLVGLSCLLWLILVTLTQGTRQMTRLQARKDIQGIWIIAAIAAIVGLLTHGLVETIWFRPKISVLWWLMVALVASKYEDVRANKREKREDRVRVLVASKR
jgi:putative inorganic carbon (HCO3(-)) transporter